MPYRRSATTPDFVKIGAACMLFWVLGWTLAKGAMDYPSTWGQTLYFIDYSFGFVKRGLFGELMEPLIGLFGDNEAGTIIIGGCITFLALACILTILYRIIQLSHDKTFTYTLALVFIGSPYIAMQANLYGYSDHLILVLASISIGCFIRKYYWLAATLMVVSLLIHEASFLVFYSTLFFAGCLQLARNQQSRKQRLEMLLSLLVPVLTMLAIVWNQQNLVEQESLKHSLSAHIFSQTPWLTFARVEGTAEAIAYHYSDYWTEEFPKAMYRLLHPEGMVYIPLIIIFLTSYLLHLLKGPYRFWLTLIATLALIAPISMLLIAYDTTRLWAMPVITGLMLLWITHELLPESPKQIPASIQRSCQLLLVAYLLMPGFTMFTPFVALGPTDFVLLFIPVWMYLIYWPTPLTNRQPGLES